MIASLVFIVFALTIFLALKSKIEANDLEQQLKDYDENSYH